MMYPYITNLGDLAFEFRLSERFENENNYAKELQAEKVAKILAPKFVNKKTPVHSAILWDESQCFVIPPKFTCTSR